MRQPTLSAISRAAADDDLLERMTAAAAAAGVDDPEGWVKMNARRIAASPVTEAGDTVAGVYDYAVATYNPTPRPGENPAVVTDDYLRAAVAAVWQLTDGPA